MARIIWTEEAYDWLEKIRDYISTHNPGAARKTINGIIERSKILARFPEIGHTYEGPPDRNVRILLYGHYRIVYEVRDSRETVAILGIFHGALDLARYLD